MAKSVLDKEALVGCSNQVGNIIGEMEAHIEALNGIVRSLNECWDDKAQVTFSQGYEGGNGMRARMNTIVSQLRTYQDAMKEHAKIMGEAEESSAARMQRLE